MNRAAASEASFQSGVRSRQPDQAALAMERPRAACMKCHVSEQVPFFAVPTPERRLTAIRMLRARGRRARRLVEGFPEWRAAGFPVEVGSARRR